MDCLKEIVTAIRAAMPDGSEIEVDDRSGQYCEISVSQGASEDEGRWKRMPKRIFIRVAREVFKDFPNAHEANQRSAIRRVESFLTNELAGFGAVADIPENRMPRDVQWEIDNSILLP